MRTWDRQPPGRPASRMLAAGLALALSVSSALAGSASGSLSTLEDQLAFPQVPPTALPAQALFADWPPESLVERSYWLPWSWLSFDRASMFSRPVLLVLTVGWSPPARQTLAETLSDPSVVREVNQNYISVLVNADRRPDIKERYQTGSWPSIAWLLPNGYPMLSQVNDRKVARPITTAGVSADEMRFLLVEGDKYWRKWTGLLFEAGNEWARREALHEREAAGVDSLASDQMEAWLLGNSDFAYGGFGAAPKFVIPGLLAYASLREARLRPALAEHAWKTLTKMIEGPLFDAEGGGVRRMSGAPMWGGIEREKMLDSNAALLAELAYALRLRDSETLRQALASTAGFVRDQLGRPGGGYYLAWIDPQDRRGDADERSSVDNLVLAGPNALAGAAMIRAGLTLGDDAIVDSGRQALELVLDRGYQPGRGSRHVIEPNPNPRVFLTAQADVALGLLDAYETTGDPRYLEAAQDIVTFTMRNLRVTGESALRDFLAESNPLGLLANPRWPLRPNTRMARAALRLAFQGKGDAYRDVSRVILSFYAGDLGPFRVHGVETALAVEEWIRDPLVIRIDGTRQQTAELRRQAILSRWPWTVVTTGAEDESPAAELTFRERSERVKDPSALGEAIQRLTGGQP